MMSPIKRSLSDEFDAENSDVMKIIPMMTKNKSKQDHLKLVMKLDSYKENNKKLKTQVNDLEMKLQAQDDYVSQAKITVLQK